LRENIKMMNNIAYIVIPHHIDVILCWIFVSIILGIPIFFTTWAAIENIRKKYKKRVNPLEVLKTTKFREKLKTPIITK
jgi:hypothetical protein